MREGPQLTVRAIGRVAKGRSRPASARPEQEAPWEEGESEIEIDAAWAEALDGIEGFSHLWVIWWLDRFGEPPTALCIHPQGRQEMPLVGLFATRSPQRPCHIAITPVKLLKHEGSRLRVQGLDAYEGTLVLDIKPYLRRGDVIEDAKMPEWLEQLWRLTDVQRETSAEH
jgi:tRNA-Thr(GGU) m(6)t(6)A37 methyltransferase TsaA